MGCSVRVEKEESLVTKTYQQESASTLEEQVKKGGGKILLKEKERRMRSNPIKKRHFFGPYER